VGVLLLFFDGVGIGKEDPSVNPLRSGSVPVFSSLLGTFAPIFPRSDPGSLTTMLPLDASLGVEGLPQSGTGQTALFTGVNAARVLGRHFGPYPHSSLRPLIRDHNLLTRLSLAGKRACFANAFPQRFFDYIERRKSHMTVTTLSCIMSGVPLKHAGDLLEGRAVSADITGKGWHELGHPEIPVVKPEEAGHRLADLSGDVDLLLFEYWKTDHAGHSMDRMEALEVLETFDRFLLGILEAIDPNRTLLVMTSDHGNIEDISIKVHTRNPVPLILYGRDHARVARSVGAHPVRDLTAVTPAILEYLTGRQEEAS
jgi:hypothetical protein